MVGDGGAMRAAMRKKKKGSGPVNINPAHKGELHRALGIAEGQPIPTSRLQSAIASGSPDVKKKAQFALTARTKFNR